MEYVRVMVQWLVLYSKCLQCSCELLVNEYNRSTLLDVSKALARTRQRRTGYRCSGLSPRLLLINLDLNRRTRDLLPSKRGPDDITRTVMVSLLLVAKLALPD